MDLSLFKKCISEEMHVTTTITNQIIFHFREELYGKELIQMEHIKSKMFSPKIAQWRPLHNWDTGFSLSQYEKYGKLYDYNKLR